MLGTRIALRAGYDPRLVRSASHTHGGRGGTAEQRSSTATIDREHPTAEGVYVYSIIESGAPKTFAKIGIGGRGDDVYTVQYSELAAMSRRHLAQVRDALAHALTRTGAPAPEPVAAGPGRSYLEARRNDSERRAELRRLDEEVAAAARHALGRVSKRAFEGPVIEDAGDLVARTTYLLRGEDEHRLADAIDGFSADWRMRGYELRATGPWPPYRSSGVSA